MTTTTTAATELKRFRPGTTGWTAADLDDPRIERRWVRGSFEIVDGVLTTMPPAYYTGGEAMSNLIYLLQCHVRSRGLPPSFPTEVDIVIDEDRVAKADAVYLTKQDKARHAQAAKRAGRPDPKRARITVPPTLIIESVSPGHEQHDHRTKRRWYAEFGVPHYWLLDGFARTLQCLVRKGTRYQLDVAGRDAEKIRPALFPGLVIPLAEVWDRDA